MQSLWNDEEAAGYEGDLAQRVYTSRLLGRDKSLVQHGGGNTSVRLRERNLVGDEEEILYVKGSGQDLEFIEEAGFAPVRGSTSSGAMARSASTANNPSTSSCVSCRSKSARIFLPRSTLGHGVLSR